MANLAPVLTSLGVFTLELVSPDDLLSGGILGDGILTGNTAKDQIWGSKDNGGLIGNAGDDGTGNTVMPIEKASQDVIIELPPPPNSGRPGPNPGEPGPSPGLPAPNPKVINGTLGDDILTGDGANNEIWAWQGNDWVFGNEGDDILVGGEGDDTLVGGPGQDTSNGGPGIDVYAFIGRTIGAVFRQSLLGSLDCILNFEPTDAIQFDFDNNPETPDLPRGLFNAGSIRARTLRDATRRAFADKNQKQRGKQPLNTLEAVFFRYSGTYYMGVNDRKAGFNPFTDFLLKLPGLQFDDERHGKQGKLPVDEYFLNPRTEI
ncbi:bluetail domain-containing putative surface protein [Thermoleptolyngbya sp.]